MFGRKMGSLVNRALYLSTSKHNGKSGTVSDYVGGTVVVIVTLNNLYYE